MVGARLKTAPGGSRHLKETTKMDITPTWEAALGVWLKTWFDHPDAETRKEAAEGLVNMAHVADLYVEKHKHSAALRSRGLPELDALREEYHVPTWQGELHNLLCCYRDGDGRKSVLTQLTRMAKIADQYVVEMKVAA